MMVPKARYLLFFVLKSIEVKRMNLRESHDVLSFKKAPPLSEEFHWVPFFGDSGDIPSGIIKRILQKGAVLDPPERYTIPKTHPFRVWLTIFGWRRKYRLFRIFSVHVLGFLLIMLINWYGWIAVAVDAYRVSTIRCICTSVLMVVV